MKNRSVIAVVLLSIITCGIYSIYWFYVTANDLNESDSEEPLMNYILALLLGIITCGIYEIYWLYKFYKKLDKVVNTDNCVLHLILSILVTPYIGAAVAQSSINSFLAQEIVQVEAKVQEEPTKEVEEEVQEEAKVQEEPTKEVEEEVQEEAKVQEESTEKVEEEVQEEKAE